jgi:hypothetical protein
MTTLTGPSMEDADADLLSMPVRQLVFQYVDEIFSDYADKLATLPEVVDEIKTIMETLLQHPPSLADASQPLAIRPASAGRSIG